MAEQDLSGHDVAAEDTDLADELRHRLNGLPVLNPVVEYIANRLGVGAGHWHMRFDLKDGHLHRTAIEHSSIGNVELQELRRGEAEASP
jgi:hypothetical protein